jgi:hypothetical protein
MGALLVIAALASPPALAAEQSCGLILGDEAGLEELAQQCRAGDVAMIVVPDRTFSPVEIAARVCDFGRQIVFWRVPDPEATQTVLACVFIGQVRDTTPVR